MKKRFPKSVAGLMDHDYLSALNPEELEYLRKFDAEYYNAEFSATPIHDPECRRELKRVKDARSTDIYGRGLRTTGFPAVEDTPQWEPTPEHLNSRGYKEARSEFRSLIPADRRESVTLTPDFLASMAKIDSLSLIRSRGEEVFTTMGRTRVERLQEQRRILWNAGVMLAKVEIKGEEGPVVTEIFNLFEQMLGKLDEKLGALGIKPPAGQEIKKHES